MQFVYTPEGADPKSWDFDPMKLLSPEAEAIERHTKMTYTDWLDRVSEGSMLALHGLLYVLLKRSDPTLKWEQVQFSLGEVTFELDDDEVHEAAAKLEARFAAGEDLSETELAQLVTYREAASEENDEPDPRGEVPPPPKGA